jgi:hypothetical protein
VTFAAGQQHLAAIGLDAGGYMAAVLALMETPAILTALILMGGAGADKPVDRGLVLREVLVGAASMMLLGGFAVGAISGQAGYERLELFVGPLFQGALCFFLLDLGLIAARGLMTGAHKLSGRVVTFALLVPVLSASLALGLARVAGLDVGNAAGAAEKLKKIRAALNDLAPIIRAGVKDPAVQAKISAGIDLALSILAPLLSSAPAPAPPPVPVPELVMLPAV